MPPKFEVTHVLVTKPYTKEVVIDTTTRAGLYPADDGKSYIWRDADVEYYEALAALEKRYNERIEAIMAEGARREIERLTELPEAVALQS